MIRTSDVLGGVTTEFVNANGLRLEVDKCGDQESRKLAICLHGFPEHAISWRYQMPVLADLGYKVWAPNMRGYGNSSIPPDVEDYALEHLMEDVGCLIDAADCDEVVLIAHDWGAVIAWYFAMRNVRPIHRLIICNVPHPGAM
ncbi:MAG: alpha/beta hydrolase, partial [Proteobacteria bacterium]|nr:alpha/beta hydrolase [Pseudomonadota bacterium]